MRGLEQIPWLYDATCAVYEWVGLARWRRWLVAEARGLTLEVGSGTGRNLPLYAEAVRLVALEPDWGSLVRGRRRAPRAALLQASVEALPFRAEVFDTVVSGLVFCSVPNPCRGLDEVRRVLRPEGRLRMLEHVRSTTTWKARLQDRVQPLWTRATGGCHPNRDTERVVEACGFSIEPGGRHARGVFRQFSARPDRA